MFFFSFWEWKSFLALHSILCSTFAKRIQKKRSGPLSFIPAVLKAQFRLLRLLKSILHKKEWTACYSTIARIAIPIIILLSIWKMWILLGDGIYWSLQEIVFCLPGKSNLKWKIRAQRSVEIWPSFYHRGFWYDGVCRGGGEGCPLACSPVLGSSPTAQQGNLRETFSSFIKTGRGVLELTHLKCALRHHWNFAKDFYVATILLIKSMRVLSVQELQDGTPSHMLSKLFSLCWLSQRIFSHENKIFCFLWIHSNCEAGWWGYFMFFSHWQVAWGSWWNGLNHILRLFLVLMSFASHLKP